MDTVFIYALNCPITGRTRYVGKADDVGIRFTAHITKAKRENNHRANWIRSVLLRGNKPVLEILDEVPANEWPQWEVAWIQFFREEGFDLVNATFGGEGNLGRVTSLETRAKIGATRRLRDYAGIKSPNFGKRHSSETRNKIRLRLTGNKNSEGVEISEETRSKQRAAALGNKKTLGKRYSPEVRQHYSEAKKLWWKNKKEQK